MVHEAIQVEQTEQTAILPNSAIVMSFEDYLKAYDSVEGIRTEWAPDGVRIYPVTNNLKHQDLIVFLIALLRPFLHLKSLGKLLLAGIPMYINDKQPAREPDLLIILTPHLDRIQPTKVVGPADVVIEIVSPESDERDHGDKFVEYEAAGVPEYWLIDPLRRETDFYGLGVDKRFHRLGRDEKGRLVSAKLPGFALDPALLWRETLPDGAELIALVQEIVGA